MSIINRVLRDLEERRADGQEGQPLVMDIRAVLPRRRRLDPWIAAGAVLGIAIIALLGFALLRWAEPPPAVESKPPVSPELAGRVTNSPGAAPVSPPLAPGTDKSSTPAAPASSVPASPQALVVTGATPTAGPVVPPVNAAAPAGTEPEALPEASMLPKVSELAKSLTHPLPKPASELAVDGQPPPALQAAPVTPVPAEAPKLKSAGKIASGSRAIRAPEGLVALPPVNSAVDKRMREMPPESRAELLFRDGVSALQLGRVNEAQAHFEDALRVLPSHQGARQALIGLLLDLQRYDEAEQLLGSALALDPKNTRYAMVLARVQVERGDNVAALRTLQAVAPVAGEDANFNGFMAIVLQRLAVHEKAVEHYRTALKANPGNAAWLTGCGISLRELGRIAEARDAFTRARAVGSLSPELQTFIDRQLKELQARKG